MRITDLLGLKGLDRFTGSGIVQEIRNAGVSARFDLISADVELDRDPLAVGVWVVNYLRPAGYSGRNERWEGTLGTYWASRSLEMLEATQETMQFLDNWIKDGVAPGYDVVSSTRVLSNFTRENDVFQMELDWEIVWRYNSSIGG